MKKITRNYVFRILPILIILLSIPVAVYLLTKTNISFLKYAVGNKADIFVDVGRRFEVKEGVWKNLAQGGEEREYTFQPILEEVSLLRPIYIRIDHIYDYYDVVKKDEGRGLIFDWSRLDVLVNDILSTGAKPFFSISYMPHVLSNSGIETDLPKDWFEWELLVQKTIERYSGKKQLGIADAYYEVWNEPDFFGNFKTYGNKNYLELYKHSVFGAEKAENVYGFKIGGPATTVLYKNWFNNLIEFSKANNLRVDFISWHSYTKDINKMEQEAFNARRWLNQHQGFFNRELIISEIGVSSELDKSYDEMFGAIHTIASAVVLETRVEKIFNFEIKDGLGGAKFSGKWGIITNEKFDEPTTKPRYDALMFLDNVKGARVNLVNEGTWIKALVKIDDNILRIIIVNYDPLARHSEAVPVSLINLPSNKFIFRRINFKGRDLQRSINTQGYSWKTVEYFETNTAAILEFEFH